MKIGDNATFKKKITEKDVYDYADVTGDVNPIHISEEIAKQSLFGERIAHGMLVAGYISRVLGVEMPGEGTICLEQSCKFIRPVRIGDEITIKCVFTKIISFEKGVIEITNSVYNQKDEIVLSGYSIVKIPKEKLLNSVCSK